jgi:gliding motility-associated protein GldM
MAGAKETPRNKLIALMYLVFITMLALNVSKEVLVGFGQMFHKISDAKTRVNESNEIYYSKIETNSKDKEGKWVGHDKTAKQIRLKSNEFHDYIQDLKDKITERQRVEFEDPELRKFEVMDKGEELDMIWFREGDEAAQNASQEFIETIIDYKATVIQVFGSQYPQYIDQVENRFDIGKGPDWVVEDREGKELKWLNYSFEGFPLISSLAKLTMMQNDIRLTEADVLTTLLGKELELESGVTESNYISLLKTEKGAYYQGENFDGSVILGRKGGAQKPNSVDLTIDGRKLNESEYELIAGGIKLDISAGSPGDHLIEGNLIFKNDGVESKIPVNQSFAVIAKPNSAVISADKMNVVYRGVENPMTISIPGIADNKVRASAPGLKRARGSKYVMNPGTGKTVKILATGTLPDGKKVSTSTTYRIKNLPNPVGTVRGEDGNVKIPKSSLAKSRIGAKFVDFDFDLTVNTVAFKVKIPGQPTIQVTGGRFDQKAISAINRAKAGMDVKIFDIRVRNPKNPKYNFAKVAPVIVELTN